VHNDIVNLNRAIEARSNKVATLFQTVEQSLAGLIPTESLREIAQGDGQVTFLSDLPFEWTAIDDWPLCQTKAVARIPVPAENSICMMTVSGLTITSASRQSAEARANQTHRSRSSRVPKPMGTRALQYTQLVSQREHFDL
jgi:hypothetical protein